MISYAPFWKTLKEKNLTQYKLRQYHNVNPSTLARIRKNEYLQLRTVEDFCKLLNCRIEDIVEYIPDDE